MDIKGHFLSKMDMHFSSFKSHIWWNRSFHKANWSGHEYDIIILLNHYLLFRLKELMLALEFILSTAEPIALIPSTAIMAKSLNRLSHREEKSVLLSLLSSKENKELVPFLHHAPSFCPTKRKISPPNSTLIVIASSNKKPWNFFQWKVNRMEIEFTFRQSRGNARHVGLILFKTWKSFTTHRISTIKWSRFHDTCLTYIICNNWSM